MLTVSRVTSISEWLLRQPLVWGGLACLAFYAMVVRVAPESSLLQRYFAGHPVEYATATLFFVGAAVFPLDLLNMGGSCVVGWL